MDNIEQFKRIASGKQIITDSIELSLVDGQLKTLFPDAYIGSRTLPPATVHPGERIQIMTCNSDGVFCESALWGFVPRNRDFLNPRSHIFATSVTRSTTSTEAFRYWRCLILATSYIVAPDVAGSTTYYRIRHADGSPMAIAGIYNPNSKFCCHQSPYAAMLMCSAQNLLPSMGQWVPQVLYPHQWDEWLRYCHPVSDAVKRLLQPISTDMLEYSEFEGPGKLAQMRRGRRVQPYSMARI